MGRTYDPFHFTISEKEPDTCIVKAKSKIGMTETQTKLPFTEKELNEKLDRFALMAEGKATPTENELKNFGQDLYKILFRDAVWELSKKTTRAAEHADGLVIELDIQSPKLSQIPWELLNDGNDFLALSRKTPVVRSVSPLQGEIGEMKPIELPVRILFAAAKPWGQIPLNTGGQARQICKSLEKAMQEGAVELHLALGEEVQSDRFRSAIRDEGYHVLHISTHGSFSEELHKGFILLEDGTGSAVPVAIDALTGMLRDTTVQVVYLDACETGLAFTRGVLGSLSETLVRSSVGAAVAMQFKIEDNSASDFSKIFYYHLVNAEPLCYAVTEARIALQDLLGRDTIDWAIPVLYIRNGYTPSMVRTRELKQRKPQTPPRCIGREAQLDELAEMLLRPSSKILLVHGFGGIGKSTLIRKIVSEMQWLFEDAAVVDCRGMRDVSEAIPKINSMLSGNGFPLVDERLKGLNESGRLEYLCEQLDKGRFLVALDNVDDFQEEPNTAIFFDLAGRFRNAKIIVACRVPHKSVAHQRELRLGALDPMQAIVMIREIGRDIQQISNATEVDLQRINEKLRGHPLSIMVAVPHFAVEPFEIALMDLPSRIGSEDDQAKEVLRWSYGRLSEYEQRFLENVSIFHGQVPMGAMLGINDGKGRGTLTELVKKNMIEFISPSKLYCLHPVLREHAYSRLGARKNEIHIKAALRIAPRLVGGFWSETLRLYQAGVDSARAMQNQPLLADLLHQLGDMHARIGDLSRARSCFGESLLITRKSGNQIGIARNLHSMGIIAFMEADYAPASQLHLRALEIARKFGVMSLTANATMQLALIEHRRGDYDRALKLYSESLRVLRGLGDWEGTAGVLKNMGDIKLRQGNHTEAAQLLSQALETFRKAGNIGGACAALHSLAVIEQDRGNCDKALKLCNGCLNAALKLGDQMGVTKALQTMGDIETMKENVERASQLYRQALEIEQRIGDRLGFAWTLMQLGRIELRRGSYEPAEKLVNQSLDIQRRLGDQLGVAEGLFILGRIEQAKGNTAQAHKLYDQSLGISRKLGDQSRIARTVLIQAQIAEEQGDLKLAEERYRQAIDTYEKLGAESYLRNAREDLERVKKLKQKT